MGRPEYLPYRMHMEPEQLDDLVGEIYHERFNYYASGLGFEWRWKFNDVVRDE